MTRSVFALALFACTQTGETPHTPGFLELCLGGAHGEATVGDTRYQRWSMSGTVVDATPTFDVGSCSSGTGPTRTLSIDDGQGNITHVGWTATTEAGAQDYSPELDVAPGDAVDVEFASVNDWGSDHILTIRDDAGLVFAGEEGYRARIHEVDPTLLGDLEVTRGSPMWDLDSNDCGDRKSDTIVFESSETHNVDIWVQTTMPVDGVATQVRNIGAWSFDGTVNCTDTWGPAPWIAYR